MEQEHHHNDDGLLRETIVRLAAHEAADALMFKQINEQLSDIKVDMKSGFNKLFGHLWRGAIGVIALLLAVSSYLYIESNKTNKEFMLEISKIVAEKTK